MSILKPFASARRVLSTTRAVTGPVSVRLLPIIPPVQLRCSSSSLSRRRAANNAGSGWPSTGEETDLDTGWDSYDPHSASHESLNPADKWAEQSSYEGELRGNRSLSSSFLSPSQPSEPPTAPSDLDPSSDAEASSTALARAQQKQIAEALLSNHPDEDSIAAAVQSFQATVQHATVDEAALILANRIRRSLPIASDWSNSQSELILGLYQRSTACRTTEPEPRRHASRAIWALCRDLLRSNKPQHLLDASHMLCDKRLTGSQVRWLLRRTTWPLRNMARYLMRTGSTVDEKQFVAVLIEQWNTAVQTTLREGKLGIVNEPVSFTSRNGSFVSRAISYFAVLLAEYASGTSLVALTTTLKDYTLQCQRVASIHADSQQQQQQHQQPDSTRVLPDTQGPLSDPNQHGHPAEMARPVQPLLPIRDIELILRHLMSRSQFRQAADFLELIPCAERSLLCYEILLERFGEGKAVGQGRWLKPPSRIGTLTGQNKLWQEALELAYINGASSRVLMRLYEARMHSHSLNGSLSLVVQDLRDLRRHGAFRINRARHTSLSVLRHPAQIAVVKTFLRRGKWLSAKSLAGKLVQDFRNKQRLAGKDPNGHFGTAIFNTLLRGLIDIFKYSSATHDGQPILTAEQLQAFLGEMNDLQSQLSITSDAVTRNIVLLALLQWDEGPPRAGWDILSELLISCEAFIDECNHGSKNKDRDSSSAVSGAASASATSTGPDARQFLKVEASILRAVSRNFFEKGMQVEARRVVAILKEVEKAAKARLKPYERSWKKPRARSPRVVMENDM